MGGMSLTHWIIVAIVVVLLFGVKRLPELGTGLGQAIINFKKAFKEGQEIDVTPKANESKESADSKGEKKEAG